MLSIKLPKITVGLFLLLLAGVSLTPPAIAQAPDDPGDTYSDALPGAQPDDDDDPLAADDDPLDRPAEPDDETASSGDRDDFALSDEERRCATEFRGFDPASGTILNDSDERERCPHLF